MDWIDIQYEEETVYKETFDKPEHYEGEDDDDG